MSESDTFLDEILDGVTNVAQPAPAPAPASFVPPAPPEDDAPKAQKASSLNGLDELLEGLSPPHDPNVPSPNATTDAPENEVPGTDRRASALVEPDVSAPPTPSSESAIRPSELPVASPREILGLPDQPEVSATNFDLANEVNDLSASEPTTATATVDSHSFAAIAREIAATVDDNDPRSKTAAQAVEEKQESDRSSMYLRTSKRRRRRRVNRMAFFQVIGLVLLLVVGLAGEWEYVSRGQTSVGTGTTAVTAPVVPIVRLPRITATKPPGTLFRFETTGSAQSAPFRMTKPFAVTWSARCTALPRTSSVQILFESSGRTALNILVGVTSHTIRSGTSAILRPGAYTVVAHSPGACLWTAQGIPRP